jgi:phosphoribosylanthranilate isomerase
MQGLNISGISVALFANSSMEDIREALFLSKVQAIQLHGSESPEFCERVRREFPNLILIRALHPESDLSLWKDSSINFLLFDSASGSLPGGTGRPFNWNILPFLSSSSPLPFFIAGGISSETLPLLLSHIQPYGIDVATGSERTPGIKDPAKIAEILKILGEPRNETS